MNRSQASKPARFEGTLNQWFAYAFKFVGAYGYAEFSGNTLWAAGLLYPPDGNGRNLGAVLQTLKADGLIVRVAAVESVLGHGTTQAVWRKVGNWK